MTSLPVAPNSALSTVEAQRLQAWTAAAREALAENTQRGYAADSKVFADWCAAEGRTGLPATPDTVSAFLQSQSRDGKAVATIRRRVATISRMHKAAGVANPCSDELVKLAIKGIARTRGTDQRQAAALCERDTVTIRARMGASAKDARDLALVLTGRDLLARASELVAVTVSDLERTDDGMLVKMRRRKTSTESHPFYIGPEAAQAIEIWTKRAGISSGPVFRSLTKGGRAKDSAMSTRDIRRTLKAVAVSAKLKDAAAVSGHSLRVGMAQDLVAADVDIASVMQAGAWSTPRMVARYTEKLAARRGAVARFYSQR